MRGRVITFFCALSFVAAFGQYHFQQRDTRVPDVYKPQSAYAVMTADDERIIGGQQKAVEDLGKRLDALDKDVSTLKDDVKALTKTDIILNFLINALDLLVPGLLITAFGVWFTLYLQRKIKAATP